MNFLNNMKIGTRLNVILGLTIVLVIGGLGIFTINIQKNDSIEVTDHRMFEQVNDLSFIIENQINNNQELVDVTMAYAEEYFYNLGEIIINKDKQIPFTAVNQITKAKSNIMLDQWILADEQIQNKFTIVDKIQEQAGGTATIFQRINDGYLRISTNVIKTNGERAVGTYIPNSSPVIQAINSGQAFYGRAFVVNAWYLTAYKPIVINGNIEGILYVGVKENDLKGLKDLFANKTYFKEGYPYMISSDGTFIIHPTKVGENFSDAEFFQQIKTSNKNLGKTYYMWEGKQKYQYFKYIEKIDSYVAVTIYEYELLTAVNAVRNMILLALALGIISFVLINLWISNGISKGLNKGVVLAENIAAGNLNVDININQKDEVGQLANALGKMTIKLREIISTIIEGANSIAAASDQISNSSTSVSQGATEQASSVEEISSTMEEIASNISQNTDNSMQTEQNSRMALENIRGVSETSEKAVDAQRNIAEKINIINDIALQTNILALNAAVEAARAGESGKGFAVVAAEVRKLAERSKIAADEIVDLAQSGLNLAEESGAKMNEAMPKVEKNTNLVQEISAASQEQLNGVNQVNNAIQQLNDLTQQNAASSEEMASSAEELSSQAMQLKDLISFFNISDSNSNNPSNQSNNKNHELESLKYATIRNEIKKSNPGIDLDMFRDNSLDADFEKY